MRILGFPIIMETSKGTFQTRKEANGLGEYVK